MKKKFTFLIAAIAAILMMAQPRMAVGQVSTATATNGNSYVVAYYVNSKYYALPQGTNAGVWTATEVELNSIDKVDTETAESLAWTLTEGTTSGQFYLTYTSGTDVYYLYKNGSTSNTNYNIKGTKTQSERHYWEFTLDNTSTYYTVKSLKSGTGSATSIYLGYASAGKYGVYASSNSAHIILLEIGDEPTTLTVSFDCDGGTANCPGNIENLEEGDDFTIPSTAPTQDCYTFGGWFDADANEYVLGQTYQCPASDLTLTADWTLNKYTVTYYSNNGETDEDVADDNLECGSAYTIADDPGFTPPTETPTFVNWNTQANGQGTTYTVGQQITISGNLNLYAQWTGATMYTVTYNCNGGESGCPNNASVVAGTQIALPAAPAREGYTFNGWLCSGDYGTYEAGAPYIVNAGVTFTAQWRQNLPVPTIQIAGVGTGTDDEYYHTVTITLANEVSGTTIRYTLDGTDPTSTSTAYTEPFAITTEGETTIKAYATREYYNDSPIAEATFTIVNRADATFTDGVYESLASQQSSDFNTWYAYSKKGNQVWGWSSYTSGNVTTYFAKMTGYVSNTKYENEDWLVSPKMLVINGKLNMTFTCATKSGDANMIAIKYSTDYPGYGDPTGYTWTSLTTSPTINYNSSYEFADYSCNITNLENNTNVYLAFQYNSTTSVAGTIEIYNFTANQCYPISYYANGGSGEMEDENSPYAVGAEVTVLANGFTAPEDKAFSCWKNGNVNLYPGNKFNMGTAAVTLTAQWVDICHTPATMAATTGASEYVNNSGTKSFKVNLSSSVTALSDCVSGGAITSYGFVYSTENETPTIDNGTVIEKGNSYTTANVEFTDEIANATLGATYYIRSYATNTAGTAYGAKATVEIPAAYPSYTISYETNGVAEATTTTIVQGDAISNLLAAPAQTVPSGYTFMGWYGDDYALDNTAPTFVKNGDAINSDLALKAVFAIRSVGGEGIAELTNTTIKNNREGKTSYGDYTIGDWSGKFMIAKNGDVYGLQLGYNTSSTASAYNSHLTTPECTYNITSITIATNNNTASGRTFYLCDADNLGTASSGTYGSGSTSAANGSVTINVSGNTKQFHIYPNGTAYIASVTLTYSDISYSDYCTSVSGSDAITGGSITNNELTGEGTIAANTAVSITNLTIKSGATLTVNGAIATEGPDNLIIEDGGQLILPNNTTVAATVKKTTTASTAKATNNWYAISTPVSEVEISSFIPTGAADLWNVYRYDEAEAEWEEYRNDANKFSTLENGRGYLYRASVANLEFAGNVNAGDENGQVTYNLSYAYDGNNPDLKGFNLLGNPFTHNITWLNMVTTKVEDAGYYLLIEEGLNQGKWSATASTTAPIAPMQAFLVQANDTDAKVTIKNSTSTSKGGEEKYNNDNIMFTVMNGQQSDEAYVFFKEGHGLNKINHRNDEIPMLYVINNGENFAIASMSDNTKVINLGFEAKTMGQYTISLKAEGQYSYMHLIDKLTGEDVDMLLEGSYTFVGSQSDRKDRFVVRLNYNAANIDTESDIFAYQNGNEIVVNGEGELQVFDVMGRMVMNQRVNGVQTMSTSSLQTGVYIFRMNEKTQKIVVR